MQLTNITKKKRRLFGFLRREEGVSAIEYAIIAALVATVVAALGPTVKGIFDTAFTKVTTAVGKAGT